MPVLLILNKKDLVAEQRAQDVTGWRRKRTDVAEAITLSALKRPNAANLLEKIISYLPEGEPYYPLDQLTDRPERFFVSEIIRKKS